MDETRCDDCGTSLGEIQIRISDGLPVCLSCFQHSRPEAEPPPPTERPYFNTDPTATNDAAYWRGMYEIMRHILAEQHPDPAYAWLDEITRMRAVR